MRIVAAILVLLLPGALSAQEPLAKRVDRAIENGRKALLARQTAGGGIDDHGGRNALSVLALLHAGESPFRRELTVAITHLADSMDGTYARSIRLMAIALLRERTLVQGHFLYDSMLMHCAREDAHALIKSQATGGGWGYGLHDRDRYMDNSNAQYAVLGLDAAVKLGIRVPPKAWSRAADHFLSQSGPYGGTGYRSDGGATPSMTCASTSSLAIALLHLDAQDERRRAMRAAVERHAEWLEKRWKITAPGIDYYTAYSLERAMGLNQMHRLGKRDWYAEGAEALLAAVDKNGSWSNDIVDTSFALLFLSRATSRALVRTTDASIERTIGRLGRLSTREEIDGVVQDLVRAGPKHLPELVPYLGDGIESIRTAAFLVLEKFTGKSNGFDATKTKDANATAIDLFRTLAADLAAAAKDQ